MVFPFLFPLATLGDPGRGPEPFFAGVEVLDGGVPLADTEGGVAFTPLAPAFAGDAVSGAIGLTFTFPCPFPFPLAFAFAFGLGEVRLICGDEMLGLIFPFPFPFPFPLCCGCGEEGNERTRARGVVGGL